MMLTYIKACTTGDTLGTINIDSVFVVFLGGNTCTDTAANTNTFIAANTFVIGKY